MLAMGFLPTLDVVRSRRVSRAAKASADGAAGLAECPALSLAFHVHGICGRRCGFGGVNERKGAARLSDTAC